MALAIAAFALFSYFGSKQFNPVLQEDQYIGITPQQEIALGLQAAPEMAAEFGGLHPDQQAQAFLDEVCRSLIANSDAGDAEWPYECSLLVDDQTINAFALPGGTVVMTDAIVQAAADKGISDDALVGVLAHEIGHVVHRHGMRMVVEQGVLNMGLGLALGDVSGVVSTGATLLTSRAYSRSHEREADCYAIALMGRASLPTAPMGQLLLAIAHDEEDEARKPKGTKPPESTAPAAEPASAPKAKDKAATPRESSPVWSLLASHPDTVQRATELQQGHAPHCAR